KWGRVNNKLYMLLLLDDSVSAAFGHCRPPQQDWKLCSLRLPLYDTAHLKKEVESLKAKHSKVVDSAKWDQLATELEQKIKQALKTAKGSEERKKLIDELGKLSKEVHSVHDGINKPLFNEHSKAYKEQKRFPELELYAMWNEATIMIKYDSDI